MGPSNKKTKTYLPRWLQMTDWSQMNFHWHHWQTWHMQSCQTCPWRLEVYCHSVDPTSVLNPVWNKKFKSVSNDMYKWFLICNESSNAFLQCHLYGFASNVCWWICKHFCATVFSLNVVNMTPTDTCCINMTHIAYQQHINKHLNLIVLVLKVESPFKNKHKHTQTHKKTKLIKCLVKNAFRNNVPPYCSANMLKNGSKTIPVLSICSRHGYSFIINLQRKFLNKVLQCVFCV